MSPSHLRDFGAIITLGLLLIVTIALHGQSSRLTEAPKPDPSLEVIRTPTISVSVERVAVDVVVKDSAGNPVTGLTQNDFCIAEDDKPQTLRSFEAYSSAALTAQSQGSYNLPQLPPNTFSDFSKVSQSGPLTVLLYDLLNTPLDAQPYARAQLLDFLRKRSHAAPLAIFALAGQP